MRTFFIGAAAICAVAAAMLVAIYLATSGPTPGRDAPRPAQAPEPVAAPAIPAPPQATLNPFARPDAPAPETIPGPARLVPPAGTWEAIPVVARASALGPVGGAVGRGLIALQPQLAACFDPAAEVRFARQDFTSVRDAEPMEDQGATILVLQLDVAPGKVTVVDAPLETRGEASDAVIVCAQRLLRGRTFELPGMQASGRYRMLHPLSR